MDAFGSHSHEQAEGVECWAVEGQPLPAAAGLSYGWSQPPSFAPDALGLYADIRQAKAEAFVRENRPALANLLLLAHGMGVVTESELEPAVSKGGLELVALFNKAMSRMGVHLDGLARRICPKATQLMGSLEVGWRCGWGESSLTVSTEPTGIYIPLVGTMPDDEAQVVYACLLSITRMGFGLSPKDLIEIDYETQALYEALDSYRKSAQQHPGLDLDAWAGQVLSAGDLFLSEFYENPDDLALRMRDVIDEGTFNLPAWVDAPLTLKQAEALHKSLKKQRQGWDGSPWADFSEKTFRAVKATSRRRKATDKAYRIQNGKDYERQEWSEEGEAHLDHGAILMIGLPFEDSAANNLYEQTMGSGEYPTMVLKLEPLAIPIIRQRMEDIATAVGLYGLACQISQS